MGCPSSPLILEVIPPSGTAFTEAAAECDIVNLDEDVLAEFCVEGAVVVLPISRLPDILDVVELELDDIRVDKMELELLVSSSVDEDEGT